MPLFTSMQSCFHANSLLIGVRVLQKTRASKHGSASLRTPSLARRAQGEHDLWAPGWRPMLGRYGCRDGQRGLNKPLIVAPTVLLRQDCWDGLGAGSESQNKTLAGRCCSALVFWRDRYDTALHLRVCSLFLYCMWGISDAGRQDINGDSSALKRVPRHSNCAVGY